ncbi:MAG: endonuclease III domain-containing protein, partial [Anaerolineae bacterium]
MGRADGDETTSLPRDKVGEIDRRLKDHYGSPRRGRLDPVSELVSAILSQNTNDRLRNRAYDRLRERFPSWEAVRDAPIGEIVDAIRIAGLAPQKGPRMKRALEHITREQGELSLDFLGTLPIDEAKDWLMDMDGVGPKTAAIVLLFALDRPAFPVDTHVHRVSRRLGLIAERTGRERAHDLLEGLVPKEWYRGFHLRLIRHGREVCRASAPSCELCPLTDLCRYYA